MLVLAQVEGMPVMSGCPPVRWGRGSGVRQRERLTHMDGGLLQATVRLGVGGYRFVLV
jgi:hypothetical protein